MLLYLILVSKETHYAFSLFPSFIVLYIRSCACKQKVLSHRKHCSWNASSAVRPLTLWLCDITLHHHLHNLFLLATLKHQIWLSTAALLLVAVLAQVCVSWPIRADWVFGGGGALKRHEPKQSISDGGDTALEHLTVWEHWCVFGAVKHVNLL